MSSVEQPALNLPDVDVDHVRGSIVRHERVGGSEIAEVLAHAAGPATRTGGHSIGSRRTASTLLTYFLNAAIQSSAIAPCAACRVSSPLQTSALSFTSSRSF